jgi:hypothetical protein
MPTPVWPVPVYPTITNTWKTISLANLVPSTATAVVICFTGGISGSRKIHARPTGQAQGFAPPIASIVDSRAAPCMDIFCKIGSNRSIDIFSDAVVNIAVTAYFTSQEVNMLDVPQKINFTRNSTWQTVDLTSFIPNGQSRGYAALINVLDYSGWQAQVGWRKTGSSKTKTNPVQGYVGTALVPMDDLNRVDLFSNPYVFDKGSSINKDAEFWITGFVSNKEILVIHDTPIQHKSVSGAYTALPRYDKSFCGIYEGTTDGVRDRHTSVTSKGWPYTGGSYATVDYPNVRGTRNYGWRTYSCTPYGDPLDKTAQAGFVAWSSSPATVWEIGYWKNLENSGLFFGTNF